MPHDKNGIELQPGDRVIVECTVKAVFPAVEFCNVALETADPMYAIAEGTRIWLNARQVVKVTVPAADTTPIQPAAEPSKNATDSTL